MKKLFIPKQTEESVLDGVSFATNFWSSLVPCLWAMVTRSRHKNLRDFLVKFPIFQSVFGIIKFFSFLLFACGLQAQTAEGVMKQKFVQQSKKLFIGLELRTSNEKMPSQVNAHWGRFYSEFLQKIPNRVDGSILALYTDYEGDYTKPFSYIIGCEVSSLDEIPEGMVGRVIPQSEYALFPTDGPFPKCMIDTWQKIWQEEKSNIRRAYTSDFELFGPDFDPAKNPKVTIHIAIKR